jgi:hypothetical protein
MSRTRRSSYPRTGKAIGYGECPEEFRTRQERGLVRNTIVDQETREEFWQPKFKRSLKKDRARKERRKIKHKLKTY